MEKHSTAKNIQEALTNLNEPQDNDQRLSEINKLRNSYNTKGCGMKLLDGSDEFLLRFFLFQTFYQEKSLTLLNNYHSYRQS